MDSATKSPKESQPSDDIWVKKLNDLAAERSALLVRLEALQQLQQKSETILPKLRGTCEKIGQIEAAQKKCADEAQLICGAFDGLKAQSDQALIAVEERAQKIASAKASIDHAADMLEQETSHSGFEEELAAQEGQHREAMERLEGAAQERMADLTKGKQATDARIIEAQKELLAVTQKIADTNREIAEFEHNIRQPKQGPSKAEKDRLADENKKLETELREYEAKAEEAARTEEKLQREVELLEQKMSKESPAKQQSGFAGVPGAEQLEVLQFQSKCRDEEINMFLNEINRYSAENIELDAQIAQERAKVSSDSPDFAGNLDKAEKDLIRQKRDLEHAKISADSELKVMERVREIADQEMRLLLPSELEASYTHAEDRLRQRDADAGLREELLAREIAGHKQKMREGRENVQREREVLRKENETAEKRLEETKRRVDAEMKSLDRKMLGIEQRIREAKAGEQKREVPEVPVVAKTAENGKGRNKVLIVLAGVVLAVIAYVVIRTMLRGQ